MCMLAHGELGMEASRMNFWKTEIKLTSFKGPSDVELAWTGFSHRCCAAAEPLVPETVVERNWVCQIQARISRNPTNRGMRRERALHEHAVDSAVEYLARLNCQTSFRALKPSCPPNKATPCSSGTIVWFARTPGWFDLKLGPSTADKPFALCSHQNSPSKSNSQTSSKRDSSSSWPPYMTKFVHSSLCRSIDAWPKRAAGASSPLPMAEKRANVGKVHRAGDL